MFEPKIRINIFKDSLWELKTIVNFVLEIGTGKSEYIINDYSIKNSFPILGSTSIIGFDNSFDYSGDFILTARVGANAGEIYKYSGEAKITDNTVYIKSNCLDYLYYSLLHYNLKRLSFGTGQPLIKTSELKKIKMFFPSPLEQSAIGALFRTLDDLLASYKDNLANYQSLKATMLSKMFPKAGQTVPEIRLDGFEGEWKLYELKSRAETITKGTTPKDRNWQGEVNYIKTESINRDTGSLIRTASTSLEEHLGYLKRSKLKEGDVLFSIVGTLGVVGIVDKKDLPANTNQQIAIIRLKRDNAIFMLNFLKSSRIKSFIKSDSTIGAQPSLSLWQIEKIKVSLPPSLQEQQAIGAYFSNLDNLINSYQDKITQLETLKKKLLQDMFI